MSHENLQNSYMRVTPIILAGGSGSRLAPLSTQTHPKQFIKLKDSSTLFEKTCDRFIEYPHLFRQSILVTNILHSGFINPHHHVTKTMLLEPLAKNTFYACALGCLAALEDNPDGWVCITPSDHLIMDHLSFALDIQKLQRELAPNEIGIFGKAATQINTKLGYMIGDMNRNGVGYVQKFIEKPTRQQAEKIHKKKNIFWNTGIILTRTKTLWDLIQMHHPEQTRQILDIWEMKSFRDKRVYVFDKKLYEGLTNKSLDTQIWEKVPTSLKICSADFDWQDLGDKDSILPYLSDAQVKILTDRTPSPNTVIGNSATL